MQIRFTIKFRKKNIIEKEAHGNEVCSKEDFNIYLYNKIVVWNNEWSKYTQEH